MKRVAVIGAGVSGLAVAKILTERGGMDVHVFEKESCAGGLIRCERINGSLFHICGGHVFNSKREDVLEWFWKRFNQQDEFRKTDRNAVVYLREGQVVPYPIENHVYMLDDAIQQGFDKDLNELEQKQKECTPNNFEQFLQLRFGQTLYDLYFEPYNRKVWQRPLNTIPLSWLEGKLPMPTVEEMRENNRNHVEEKQFVHSSFYYENENGSQFIADRLAEGLNIHYDTDINRLEYASDAWIVNGEKYDYVFFCGNIKQLPSIIRGVEINEYVEPIDRLESHGTTAVFCEIDRNPYSWIYQPSASHRSHRIICTGNFAATNNDTSIAEGRMTATIEFTDEISEQEIRAELEKIPFHPRYITHHYSPYTYPIQDSETRTMIASLKSKLVEQNLFITGRFADWEYYNMDVAIGAAMDTIQNYLPKSK